MPDGSSFDRDGLRQVPGLVDVRPSRDGGVIGEELERDDREDGAQRLMRVGYPADVVGEPLDLGIAFRRDGDHASVAGAEGRHFWDYDGRRYLDFASQLVNVNIGHQHPKIVAAIKEQADKLCTIGPPMASETRSRLGRMLAEVTPGDLNVSFFTNGGAEANENAVKLARLATGRHKVIARYCSYHGATNGAVTLTGSVGIVGTAGVT